MLNCTSYFAEQLIALQAAVAAAKSAVPTGHDAVHAAARKRNADTQDRIRAWLKAHGPAIPAEIATGTRMGIKLVRRHLSAMAQDNQATNIGSRFRPRWKIGA